MEVSGGRVLLRWVLLQKKKKKDTLILDTCNITSFCISSCAKNRTKGRPQWKSGCLSFKLSKTSESLAWVSCESGQRSTFFQGFQKLEVSSVGVHLRHLRWVLLQKKEEKQTLILDTCNIISVSYFFLRKEWNERKATVENASAFPSRLPKHRSLWCGCPFKEVFTTEKGRKGRPKHSKHLGRPS